MSILNVADAESSYLKGSAEFEQWRANFEAMWDMPMATLALAMYLRSLPEEVKIRAPVDYAIAQKRLDELTGA